MRFSLRWLFGAVAFVATGCLSLVYTSELLCNALGVAVFLFLAFAVLGAIYGREDTRPFWIGCAIFGWSYIASSSMPAGAPGAWEAVDVTLVHMDMELDSIVSDRKVSQGDFECAWLAQPRP